MPTEDELIDRIYEAAAIPQLWLGVLQELAEIAECHGGTLFTVDAAQNVRFLSTESLSSFMTVFVRDGWMDQNSRAGRLAPKKHAGFVTDLDLFTREEMDSDPFYTGFLRPNGGGWGTGTVIPVPSGDMIVFNIERSQERGPVEREAVARLDALRPHLARAALISVRLQLEKATSVAETLALVGLPGAVVGRSGRLLAANTKFESLIPTVFRDQRQNLSLSDGPAGKLLENGMARIQQQSWDAPLSIPVPGHDDQPPMIVHVVPVRGAAQDIFSFAAAVLVVTTVEQSLLPTADMLSALFDLTPSEARVARGISGGQTVESIASETGRSKETVRSQLKAIFSKTGTARQAELVSLLAGKHIPA